MKIKTSCSCARGCGSSGLGKCPGRRLFVIRWRSDSVESGAEILFGSSAFTGVFEFVLDAHLDRLLQGRVDLRSWVSACSMRVTPCSPGLVLATTSASLTSVTLDAGSYHYAPVFPASGGVGALRVRTYAAMVPEPPSYALHARGLGMLDGRLPSKRRR